MASTAEERKFAAWCRKQDGVECFKFVSPGRAGVPDRVVWLSQGRVLLIEFKNKGEKLTGLQAYWRDQFVDMGHEHHVCTSQEEAKEIVRWHLQT